MSFFKVTEYEDHKTKVRKVRPSYRNTCPDDLIIRGGAFYAVYLPEKGLWSTEEFDLVHLVDKTLESYSAEHGDPKVMKLEDQDSGQYKLFKSWLRNMPDNPRAMNRNILFRSSPKRKEDYATKRLSYDPVDGDYSAYDRLMGTLFEPPERQKLEWAAGSILAGDSKKIQKFFVLYGRGGVGKSTFFRILNMLFEDYVGTFQAKALGQAQNRFALEPLKSNPLLAIDDDGDLSKIEDNTRLNQIVSHERQIMDEKGKGLYEIAFDTMLFVGTNSPVKITDAKSGVIRRLIDVRPSGHRLPISQYELCIQEISETIPHIAKRCLDVYRALGPWAYEAYEPIAMRSRTEPLFNFALEMEDELDQADGITLKRAYSLYKQYCEMANIEYKMPMYVFRESLKDFYDTFKDRDQRSGMNRRSVYYGFDHDSLRNKDGIVQEKPEPWLKLDNTDSYLDERYADRPAQYATPDGHPGKPWDDVTKTLKELDTRSEHFVRPPVNEVVIDFDLSEGGSKSLERNIAAAAQWPPTYAELSRSGGGIHLHYVYDGDTNRLRNFIEDGIECKVYRGKSALRRRLTKCGGRPTLARLSEGDLPLKDEPVISDTRMKSEKALRQLVLRNLRKEIHPGTKPSVDFIRKILDDAYSSDLSYDISDMRNQVMAFAASSTHHGAYCLEQVAKMHFQSENDEESENPPVSEGDLIFFDCEVFPNLFLLNWKVQGNEKVVRMINPDPEEVEALCRNRLVGFNNRRYDNHILYARIIGYSNYELYKLSKRIIESHVKAGFVEAYNLSYTDVYDFAAKKQSLKKWEIELGLKHDELGFDWDEPVPEEHWTRVSEYCDNDVISTEKVFDHLREDWVARQVLAKVARLTPNHSTNALTTRIIFGKEKHPQLVYTDLSEMFPGYKYEYGKSTYKGVEVGEGGYVYAEPGIHRDVALLDVASLHPTSIEQLNLFGEYTSRFSEIKMARIAVKHGDTASAASLLGGALGPYLGSKEELSALAYALKIAINSVYGLTAAKFDNPFRDPRNVDNIVAKRGALFMVDLKEAVQERGLTVAHIKTDSIKIPNATPEDIQFVMDFGKKYGYDFEHEATYDRMCLVNDAVYIAHDESGWHATGKQFQEPYVYKKLFTREPIEFDDYIQAKSVTSRMYLAPDSDDIVPEDLKFIGRVGTFVPVVEGGGRLLRETRRKDPDGQDVISYGAVAGTKGYLWMESGDALLTGARIDQRYYDKLAEDALDQIRKYGDEEIFRAV
jgi:hypothetical protein